MHVSTTSHPRPWTARLRPRARLSWLSLPAAAGIVVLFLAPVGAFLLYSVMTGAVYSFNAELPLTFDNLRHAVSDQTVRSLATNSLTVGFLAATSAMIVSLPVAYWLRYHAGRLQPVVLLLIVLTFFSSYLVRVYAWRTVLGENGVLNEGLMRLGILDAPAQMLLYSRFSVVIALVHILTPIFVLLLYAGFRPLDERYLEAAQDLGAGTVHRWRKVILPAIAVPITSAWMLGFVMASADYVTPQMLGGPGQSMVGLEIQTQLRSLGDYPAGAALSLGALVTYGVLYTLIGLGLRLRNLNRIEWKA